MTEWLRQWFYDGDAIIARPSVADIERLASVDEAIEQATKLGWHLVAVQDQIVLIRDEGNIQILC